MAAPEPRSDEERRALDEQKDKGMNPREAAFRLGLPLLPRATVYSRRMIPVQRPRDMRR